MGHAKQSLFLTLLFAAFFCSSQGMDSRLWTGVKVEKDLIKQAEAGVSVQYRRESNWSAFDQFFWEPYFNWELSDRISMGAEYRFRYSRKAKTNQTVGEQRATLHLQYKQEVGADFEFGLKTALQYGMDADYAEWYDHRNELINRTKVKMSYHIFGTPLSVSLAEEAFCPLNQEPSLMVDKWRTNAGITYDYSNSTAIEISYLFDYKVHRGYNDRHSQILSLKYAIKL